MRVTATRLAAVGTLLALPGLALAEEPVANASNTAWILTSTALVLFMTLPGLALFYGGLVRSKNVLSVLMQCFAIAGMVIDSVAGRRLQPGLRRGQCTGSATSAR